VKALRFVTTNAGKVAELRDLLAPIGWTVVQDARGYPELQAATLAEVTRHGADHLLREGLLPPFALEDSGLFVDALHGFPGPFSRYALDTLGVEGLLRLLDGVPEDRRGASFRTDLLYVDASGARHHLAGEVRGRIAPAPRGAGGFGFDPLFIPEGPPGPPRTFAEMDRAEKSSLSHRGIAVRRLVALLAG